MAHIIQEFFSASDDSDLISADTIEHMEQFTKPTSEEYLEILQYDDWIRRSQISEYRPSRDDTDPVNQPQPQPTQPGSQHTDNGRPPHQTTEDEIRPDDSASNLTARLTLAQFRVIDARILQHCIEAGTFFLKYGPSHRLRLSEFVTKMSTLTSRRDLYNLMHESRQYSSWYDSFKTEPYSTRYGSEFYNGQTAPEASTRYDEAITGPISRTAVNAHNFRQIVLRYLLTFLHSHDEAEFQQVVRLTPHQCHLSQVCPWNWYATVETPVSPAADPDIETWLANKAIEATYQLELPTKYFSTYSLLSMSFRYLSTHQLFARSLAASSSPPSN
jgi:hypothetical protein